MCEKKQTDIGHYELSVADMGAYKTERIRVYKLRGIDWFERHSAAWEDSEGGGVSNWGRLWSIDWGL